MPILDSPMNVVLDDVDTAGISQAVNRLWLPHFSLSACIRCVVSRDTRAIALTNGQRLSFYPATPMCTISWYFHGDCEIVKPAQNKHQENCHVAVPARIVLSGPQTQPSVTWAAGPAHGMMLLLMPDALRLLTGIEPAKLVDQTIDVHEVFAPHWLAMCEAVAHLHEDELRVNHIQNFLEPLWRDCSTPGYLSSGRLQDWVVGLGLRAATSRQGRSLRHTERRVKQWAGLPLRELHLLAHAEESFFKVLEAQPLADFKWSHFASDAGYFDQSHLCRVSRRVTGFSPEELRQRMQKEDAFWLYRLWA